VLREPIVRMLFQHGAFSASDTSATAQALLWLSLALPAHVLVKALSPAFFARGDTATPLWATLKGLAVAIVLALLLGRLFGAAGIAASIAMGAWSSALALIRRGAATFGFSIDAAARRRLPRIVAAAIGMGGLLWLKTTFVLPLAANAPALAQAALLLVLVAGGIMIYGLLLLLLDVIGWTAMVRAIRAKTVTGLRD
jgi:putative peptidoglycan lipid II flippase